MTSFELNVNLRMQLTDLSCKIKSNKTLPEPLQANDQTVDLKNNNFPKASDTKILDDVNISSDHQNKPKKQKNKRESESEDEHRNNNKDSSHKSDESVNDQTVDLQKNSLPKSSDKKTVDNVDIAKQQKDRRESKSEDEQHRNDNKDSSDKSDESSYYYGDSSDINNESSNDDEDSSDKSDKLRDSDASKNSEKSIIKSNQKSPSCTKSKENSDDDDDTNAIRELGSYNEPLDYNEYKTVQSIIDNNFISGLSRAVNIDNKILCAENNLKHYELCLEKLIESTKQDIHDYTDTRPYHEIPEFYSFKTLGHGSYGEAYLILKANNNDKFYHEREYVDGKTNLYVFKKFMLPKKAKYKTMLESMLDTEIKISYTFNHPNIYRFFGAYSTKWFYGFIQEYLCCGHLFDIIYNADCFENNTQLYKKRMLFYSSQLLLALEYLHERGIFHCDIKMDNICLDYRGYAKLIDFGNLVQISQEKIPETHGIFKAIASCKIKYNKELDDRSKTEYAMEYRDTINNAKRFYIVDIFGLSYFLRNFYYLYHKIHDPIINNEDLDPLEFYICEQGQDEIELYSLVTGILEDTKEIVVPTAKQLRLNYNYFKKMNFTRLLLRDFDLEQELELDFGARFSEKAKFSIFTDEEKMKFFKQKHRHSSKQQKDKKGSEIDDEHSNDDLSNSSVKCKSSTKTDKKNNDKANALRELGSYNQPLVYKDYKKIQSKIDKNIIPGLTRAVNIDKKILRGKYNKKHYELCLRKLIESSKLDTQDCTDSKPYYEIPEFYSYKELCEGDYGEAYLILKANNNDKFYYERDHLDPSLLGEKKNLYVFKKFTFPKEEIDAKKLKDMLDTEIKISCTFNHPNIYRFFGAYSTKWFYGFIQEYLCCGYLFDIIDDDECFRKNSILYKKRMFFYSSQLLVAIEYLHERGIFHCDIKIDSICLDYRGYAKLMGFGNIVQISQEKIPETHEIFKTIVSCHIKYKIDYYDNTRVIKPVDEETYATKYRDTINKTKSFHVVDIFGLSYFLTIFHDMYDEVLRYPGAYNRNMYGPDEEKIYSLATGIFDYSKPFEVPTARQLRQEQDYFKKMNFTRLLLRDFDLEKELRLDFGARFAKLSKLTKWRAWGDAPFSIFTDKEKEFFYTKEEPNECRKRLNRNFFFKY